jgi:hypothetical protein
MPNRSQYKLVRAFYASAIRRPGSPEGERHQQYINALKHAGVEFRLGHFVSEEVECRGCTRRWDDPHEKESDVNLALAVLDDAHRNVFDIGYIVTADSDQAATARIFKTRFPQKQLVSIVPPGMEPSKAIKTYIPIVKLPKVAIEECLFPESASSTVDGKHITHFTRPSSYDPPMDWLPPSKRPKPATKVAPATVNS